MFESVDVSQLMMLRQLQQPGQPDVVERIVSSFLTETDERLATLRLAVEGRDFAGLEAAAHALKGIAAAVGATELRELSRRLEQVGCESAVHEAPALLTEFEQALGRARPIFERLRGST